MAAPSAFFYSLRCFSAVLSERRSGQRDACDGRSCYPPSRARGTPISTGSVTCVTGCIDRGSARIGRSEAKAHKPPAVVSAQRFDTARYEPFGKPLLRAGVLAGLAAHAVQLANRLDAFSHALGSRTQHSSIQAASESSASRYAAVAAVTA